MKQERVKKKSQYSGMVYLKTPVQPLIMQQQYGHRVNRNHFRTGFAGRGIL